MMCFGYEGIDKVLLGAADDHRRGVSMVAKKLGQEMCGGCVRQEDWTSITGRGHDFVEIIALEVERGLC